MRLLLVSTDDANAYVLSRATPNPPVGAGASAVLRYKIQEGPLVFARLQLGPDRRVQSVGPVGIRPHGGDLPWDAAAWRVDEVEIDGEVRCAGPDGWGVGRTVAMRVTNTGNAPAHFYATWELEDVH